jgi:hypothetical protein
MAVGAILTVFLSPALAARRSHDRRGVAEIRYSGKPAAFLRGFRAITSLCFSTA